MEDITINKTPNCRKFAIMKFIFENENSEKKKL